jgi:F-type H+-transporting ATPase subunit epsilon
MAKLHLEVVTPEKQWVKEEGVDDVTIPGALGEFEILPGHTTLLAEIGSGKLTYTKSGQSHSVMLSGGFAQVGDDLVVVLADTAEN